MPDAGIAALMIVAGVAVGTFGSLVGLGGGVLLVPLLTLGFGLPLREAVGVSLVAVIVTSSASAAVYLERHVADLRLGMTLELFTASGALIGGLVAFALSEQVLAALFTAMLVYTALSMARRRDAASTTVSAAASDIASAPSAAAPGTGVGDPGRPYVVRNLGLGIVGSLFAGLVSALLGVGGGVVKVPLMHLAMGVPLRVATATSNLMIGITGAASAIIYLLHGGIDPFVAGPTSVGVFIGASIGSRSAHRVDVRILRLLFVGVLLVTASQMAGRALR